MAGLAEAEISSIYSQYGAMMRRRCRALLRDVVAADDVFQNVFVKLLKHGALYREAEAKLPWLYRVCDRACFDFMRGRKRYRGEDKDALAALTASESGSESLSLLVVMLGKFDERSQQVIVAHYLDGLTQDEIAVMVGWSRQTVNRKLGEIQQKVHALRQLEEQGRL